METGPSSVRDLEIWNEGVDVVKATYGLTRTWPKDELYGLISQARRAAVSVPANLAEGLGRGTPKEMARFAQIALGSLYELDTLLYLSAELEYSSKDGVAELRERLTSLAKRTSSFIRYQGSRQ